MLADSLIFASPAANLLHRGTRNAILVPMTVPFLPYVRGNGREFAAAASPQTCSIWVYI